MIRLAGRRHLRHRVFHGPAERTLVELWLTEIVGLTINGYADVRGTGPAAGSSGRLIFRSGTACPVPATARTPIIATAAPIEPTGAPALIGDFTRRPRVSKKVAARAVRAA